MNQRHLWAHSVVEYSTRTAFHKMVKRITLFYCSVPSFNTWKGVRAVEGGGLENR